MAMGKIIQQRLDKLNWSQNKLVKSVPGLSSSTLSSIILNDYATSRFAEGIARALGLQLADLIPDRKEQYAEKLAREKIMGKARKQRLAAFFRRQPFPMDFSKRLSSLLSGKGTVGGSLARNLEVALNLPFGYLVYPQQNLPLSFGSAATTNIDQTLLGRLDDLNVLVPKQPELPENCGERELPAYFTVEELLMLSAYRKCPNKVQAIINNLVSYVGSAKAEA
jgi:transcriptional regulator with XRE-family HTH domain